MRPILSSLLLAVSLAATPLVAQSPVDLLHPADEAWVARSEGGRGGQGDRRAADAAVAAAEAALQATPESLEVRWRLLRALYFLGEYGLPRNDEEGRLEVHRRARDLAEEGIEAVETTLGGKLRDLAPEPTAARLAAIAGGKEVVFWAAVHWGAWAELEGKIAAARKGVAGIIRDYSGLVIAVDPRYEEAGGLRVQGRLHSESPKLPFFTGWVDRETAIASLEKAVEIAPENMLNHMFLAEAILDHEKSRRQDALEILRRLADSEPRPRYPVEEARIVDDARVLLARETGGG